MYLQCGYPLALACRALAAKDKLENILLSQMTVTRTTTQSLNSLLPWACCPFLLPGGAFQGLCACQRKSIEEEGYQSYKITSS